MARDFGDLWLTRSAPHFAYSVLPKCGCSSIGQLFHYFDRGVFHAGTIHAPEVPLLKVSDGTCQAQIEDILASGSVTRFTLGRNPYRRLLSAFANKIFGFGLNGRRYRGGLVHAELGHYGLSWGPKSNIAGNMRSFVHFVGDTLEHDRPIPPDLHWQPMIDLLRLRKAATPLWELDFVGHLESFGRDLNKVLALAGKTIDLASLRIPHENATNLPPLPMSDYFGPEEQRIMARVYAEDFELFGYSTDPDDERPSRPVVAADVNSAMLVGRKREAHIGKNVWSE